MNYRFSACLAALLLGLPQAALAVSCTASTTSVVFGTYSPVNSVAQDGVGNVQISCSVALLGLLINYTILLSSGGANSFSPRALSGGTPKLNYNLYGTVSRLSSGIWGDGSGGSTTVSDSYLLGVGTTVRNYAVYGRIPALQVVNPGNYTDSITVTVNY